MRAVLLSLLLLAVAAPAAAAVPKLDWHDCRDGFQCATAVLPQDYSKPHGPKVRLALVKRPAIDQEHRIGSLFLNPGGPGNSGIEFVRTAPPAAFQLLSRFDWVGWDPRGVGASEPTIDCEEAPAFEPTTPDTFDLRTLLKRGRELSRLCLNHDRRFLASVNTGNSARDLDQLRAAVGDKKLSYVGISWGGMLGETYTSMFPGRTRALLLDSPADGDVWLNRPLTAGLQQNVGFERSLERFLAATGIAEEDYDALLARLREHPIDVGDGRSIDDRDVRAFVVASLYSKLFGWPELAAALRAAEAGDADALRSVPEADSTDALDDVFEAQLAVERRHPRRLAPYLDAAEDVFALAPHFAFGAYEDVSNLFWPVRARGAYYGPFRHDRRATPALVMHTTHDPATPLAWGKNVVRDLGNARLLTYRGDGHRVVTDLNPCILAATAAYLERLELPPEGASCDQN
jgi:pimeloyl-ACP methyl ester carboxylesterase